MGSKYTEAKFGLVINATIDNRINTNNLITYHSTSCKKSKNYKQGEPVKGAQLYGDGWKLDFGGERAVVQTDTELRGGTLETYAC